MSKRMTYLTAYLLIGLCLPLHLAKAEDAVPLPVETDTPPVLSEPAVPPPTDTPPVLSGPAVPPPVVAIPDAPSKPQPITFSLRVVNTTKQRLDVRYLCPNTLDDPFSIKGDQWHTHIRDKSEKTLLLKVANPHSVSYQCVLLINGEGENAFMVRLLANTGLQIKLCSVALLGFRGECKMQADAEENQYLLTLSFSEGFL